MLRELYIENIAVIERASLQLIAGLNVLTGETGAGKSMLIGAVNAILGNRTSKDIIRRGADRALISAVFEDISPAAIAKVQQLGYLCEDGQLLITREILKDGRNICKIGGRPANVTILKELGETLITVHGQHDSQQLLDESRHVEVLDRYGQLEDLLGQYYLQFDKVRQLKKQVRELEQAQADRDRQIDILSYQISEIETAQLQPEEDSTLEGQRDRARYAGLIAQNLRTALGSLQGEDAPGALELLDGAVLALQNIRDYLPELGAVCDKLQSLRYEIEEYAGDISAQQLDDEEYLDIDFIESRLDTIYRLKKKYGQSIEEILAYSDSCRQKLAQIEGGSEQLEALRDRMKTELHSCKELALQLMAKRKKVGQRLAQAVCRELAFLNMPGVRFVVQVEPTDKLHPRGMDEVRFLISANVGEEPKSISKIASGGELSRIMLAIKSILADKDGIDTLIFDEIDTGVSGSAAQRIGQKLGEVAASHQIICVTHSAQVAAYGASHLLIQKTTDGSQTFTDVRALGSDERITELARIVSGDHITPLALENAREILAFAHGSAR